MSKNPKPDELVDVLLSLLGQIGTLNQDAQFHIETEGKLGQIGTGNEDPASVHNRAFGMK